MHHLWKKGLALALIFCVSVSGVGCSGNKKDKKKEPAATEDVSSEKVTELPKVEAGGKGKDKSDVPLVVACPDVFFLVAVPELLRLAVLFFSAVPDLVWLPVALADDFLAATILFLISTFYITDFYARMDAIMDTIPTTAQ